MKNDRAAILCVVTLIFGVALGVPLGDGYDYAVDNTLYYAEGYYHNHDGVTLAFGVQNYRYTLFFNDTKLNGFTCIDNQNLTANKTGVYKVDYQSAGTGRNNHEYILAVCIDGVEQENTEVHKKMAAGGDIVTMSGTGIIEVTAGQKITLCIMDISGTGDGTYIASNLNLIKIGD